MASARASRKRFRAASPDKEADECPICLEGLAGRAAFRTSCGHEFHFRCIASHVDGAGDPSCPLCRRPFRDMTPPARARKGPKPARGSPLPPGEHTPSATIEGWTFDARTKTVHGTAVDQLPAWRARHGSPGAEGTAMSTSPVVCALGRLVTTLTGSVYRLGAPDPSEEVEDPENPLEGRQLY